ncbi:glucooligosaccharide oxidase [Sistotremastrum niveocremeum HHB9708]|nr:glucooligosaccharide oxidase [Sistotremastrum niveocremeum HHB9708]
MIPLSFVLAISAVWAAPNTGNPNALWSCLSGKGWNLETVSNANYAKDSTAFNERLSFKPVAIVSPPDLNGVAGAVNCARTNNFKVSALSGGHSYAAFGLGGQDNQVVINLKNLKNITLNSDGTVVSGTGNRLGDLAQAIWDQGQRALPHGTCPYVGTGGHTSYGGFGLFSRQAGLLLDTVVSAQVVLANGEVVTASPTQNTDIFWAIRGAAPSFGIVVSWTYQTVPAPSTVTFQLGWSKSLTQNQFVTAFSAFQNFSTTAPNALGFDGDIGADGNGGISLTFLGVWYGAASQFQSTIAPFLAKIPAGYTLTANNMTWIQQLDFLAGSSSLSTAAPDTLAQHDTFFAKSLMTTGPSSQTALNSFASYLYSQGAHSDTNWFIGFDLYGGKISQTASNATAYTNRNAFITYQFYASSQNSNPPYPADGISFVTNMLNSLEPNPQEAYPNYVDPTLTAAQWKSQYFSTNYARLLSIKNSVDPQQVFSFPQSIS